MFLILLAAQVATQAPAVPPAPKVKPKQVCEMVELTGSRSKRRICHNVNDSADLSGYGVSNNAFGKAKIDQSGATGSPTPQ